MPRPSWFKPFGVFVLEGFLPPALGAAIADVARADGGEAANVIARDDSLQLQADVRQAWELALPESLHRDLANAFAAMGPRLEEAFDVRLGPHEGVAVLRYPPGAFYLPHRDRADFGDAAARAITVIVFVNGARGGEPPPFDGGALRFYEVGGAEADEGGVDMVPEAGTLVGFRSEQLHEVTPVTRGERITAITWFHISGRS